MITFVFFFFFHTLHAWTGFNETHQIFLNNEIAMYSKITFFSTKFYSFSEILIKLKGGNSSHVQLCLPSNPLYLSLFACLYIQFTFLALWIVGWGERIQTPGMMQSFWQEEHVKKLKRWIALFSLFTVNWKLFLIVYIFLWDVCFTLLIVLLSNKPHDNEKKTLKKNTKAKILGTIVVNVLPCK